MTRCNLLAPFLLLLLAAAIKSSKCQDDERHHITGESSISSDKRSRIGLGSEYEDDAISPAGGEKSQDDDDNNDEDEPQTYGVIVDCGSSGTRAHIYQWDSRLDYPELLHDIAPKRDVYNKPVSKKFSPGLSSLADKTTQEAYNYIKQVADYIVEQVPADRHANTAIYMLATAGMRLLDETTQVRIMKDVRDYVDNNYHFADVRTSVIPGSHEGMYQWISVNAKAKRFLDEQTSGRTKTYAVIEMGGASVQVTYQLRPGMSNILANFLDKSVQPIYLAQRVEPAISRHDSVDNTYLLHSTTFLGFGGNSAREAYLDLLIKKHYTQDYMKKFLSWSRHLFASCFGAGQNKKKKKMDEAGNSSQLLTIRDPCAPEGFVTDEIKKPRRMLDVKNRTIGFIAEDDEPTFNLRIMGTGQYGKCKKYVEEMVKLAREEKLNCKQDEPNECTMELVGKPFIPFSSLDFLGIGDIYYTMNIMLELQGTYDHEKVVKKTKQICQTPYEQLKRQFPQVANNLKLANRIESECFKAVWVDTFLVRALGMPEDFKMLKTTGQISGDDLEWTLGAVLDKSLAIDAATEGEVDGESEGVRQLESPAEGHATAPAETAILPETSAPAKLVPDLSESTHVTTDR